MYWLRAPFQSNLYLYYSAGRALECLSILDYSTPWGLLWSWRGSSQAAITSVQATPTSSLVSNQGHTHILQVEKAYIEFCLPRAWLTSGFKNLVQACTAVKIFSFCTSRPVDCCQQVGVPGCVLIKYVHL